MGDAGARPVRLTLAGLAVVVLAAATAGPSAPPLKALRWTDPVQKVAALTRQPPECLALPPDPRARTRMEVGRAVFRTPLLLGGQAARLGLSCESCHNNGRTNRAFHFPGLSGAAGTADVTSSLMSKRRGNGAFDPIPIPDLALPGKVDRDPAKTDLRNFIRGLVVEEFDGHEPPPAVLDGLVAYVGALRGDACPAAAVAPLRASLAIDASRRAVLAGGERWQAQDRATAGLLLDAARSELGQVDERYAGLPTDHAALIRADAELAAIRRTLLVGRAYPPRRIEGWLARLAGIARRLERDEHLSLYSPGMLETALEPR